MNVSTISQPSHSLTRAEFHRFQVIQGNKDQQGKLMRTKTVGMAYLRVGQDMYTLRLWTFLHEKFFLVPSNKEPGRYLVMTREPTRNVNSKAKYFWNIVGSARVDSSHMYMEIEFDLFDRKVYMSLFPESQVEGKNLPEPPDFNAFDAAA